jgi:flagellar basal body-associated protein FliL
MKPNASRNQIVQVYIACLAMFVALAVGGYFLADRAGLIAHPRSAATQDFVTDMAYYDLPHMNISMGGGRSTHLWVDIALEVARKDMPIIAGYQPQIMDKLNLFFSKMKPEDVEQPDAMPALRQEILWQINSAGAPIPVHDMMLRRMVIM